MPKAHDSAKPERAFPKGVARPAIRALNGAGYKRFEELSGESESELAKLHGMGPKALRIIQQELIDAGLEPMKT
jgi:hypothetical protein